MNANPTKERAYFDLKGFWQCLDGGHAQPQTALYDTIYRHMVDDAALACGGESQGNKGQDTDLITTGSHRYTGSSDKPRRGPAKHQQITAAPAAS